MVEAQTKYLDLTLDGRWRLEPHFKGFGQRIVGIAAALGRLFPTTGRPGSKSRQLYAGVTWPLRSAVLAPA